MKRILWIAILQFIAVTFFMRDVHARERHTFYSGVRCQGMGGACIAAVNDETALLVNPAGLGKLRDFYGTVFDPELEFGYQTQGFYADKNFTNPYSLQDVLASLNAHRSAPYHAKAQVFPSFVGRNFGIGLYGNYLLDAKMSGDGSTVDTFYRSDMALALGFNFRLFDGRIKLGFNTKLIDRIEIDNSALSATGPLSTGQIGSSGVGLSTDMGLIMTAPWALLPTVSAVVRDIGNTTFTQSSGVRLTTPNRPNMVNQDIDVGMAFFPIYSNSVRSTFIAEYRGLLTSKDEPDKAKLIHGGLELNFSDVLFLRAGYNQRYWTAGVELSSEHFQLQVASYGEEIGTASAPEEDRRYTFKFAYRY
ncbi:MAG: hypothetical protein ACXVCY_02020 [Pseudobdellovibrionaceae bacterium]